MNLKLILKNLMITLLCLQMFNISIYGFSSTIFCHNHNQVGSVLGMLTGKCQNGKDIDQQNSSNPTEEKSNENCDFVDLTLYHDHTIFELPALFHIERKNDNHHFTDDLKSHVLAVVSPPPEC